MRKLRHGRGIPRRQGYSLMELVIVIIIIGILAAAGIGFGGKQIANARMSTVSSNLKVVANDVEDAISNVGFLKTIDNPSATQSYFDTWDASYLTSPLDTDTIISVAKDGVFGTDFTGAILQTRGYKDSWDNEMKLFYMIPVSGTAYRIIIASAGPNGKWATDATYGYINGTFEDDVVMVMEPRQ